MVNERRKRLEEASYPDLDAMMAGYAAAAVAIAREGFSTAVGLQLGIDGRL